MEEIQVLWTQAGRLVREAYAKKPLRGEPPAIVLL